MSYIYFFNYLAFSVNKTLKKILCISTGTPSPATSGTSGTSEEPGSGGSGLSEEAEGGGDDAAEGGVSSWLN